MEALALGALAGTLAAAPMYALLFPVARGEPLPPDVFAARLLRREPRRASAPGMILQGLFGAFYGFVMAATIARFGPVAGSIPVHGTLVGLAAFVLSLLGFVSLGLLRRPLDLREWAGHFLNHVVFGVTLGLLFLAFS